MTLDSWAANELSCLGYQNSVELTHYLLGLEDEASVDAYLGALLDTPEAQQKFKEEFLKRYREAKSTQIASKTNAEKTNKKEGQKNKNLEKESLPVLSEPQKAISQEVSTKKKTKFVSLYSEEGQNRDVILLPGRHRCDCQASKHKLINNCLKCGRIVCEQEGSGPCSFCNTLVVSKAEKEYINRGTKKSEALHNKLLHSKKVHDNKENEIKPLSKGLQKAIEHKNKLLEFDKTSEKRTKVFDDESDYFYSNSKWINPADREKLQQYEEKLKIKKYDRSNQKFTIDLLGRKVVADQEQKIYDPEDEVLKAIFQDMNINKYSSEKNEDVFQALNILRPIYMPTDGDENCSSKQKRSTFLSGGLEKLQDKELQEMRDEGVCLSMHQPWASLLIAGIKIHEGRTWYHHHRGRLWIAAAAKIPTPSEISNLEQSYRILLKNEHLKFPQHYPTSCLLGCVDVVDILPQEDYRKQFPEGESDSPYVFICENPQEMIIKFPIKGQHKIYKLDPKIHNAAMKSLKIK